MNLTEENKEEKEKLLKTEEVGNKKSLVGKDHSRAKHAANNFFSSLVLDYYLGER